MKTDFEIRLDIIENEVKQEMTKVWVETVEIHETAETKPKVDPKEAFHEYIACLIDMRCDALRYGFVYKNYVWNKKTAYDEYYDSELYTEHQRLTRELVDRINVYRRSLCESTEKTKH